MVLLSQFGGLDESFTKLAYLKGQSMGRCLQTSRGSSWRNQRSIRWTGETLPNYPWRAILLQAIRLRISTSAGEFLRGSSVRPALSGWGWRGSHGWADQVGTWTQRWQSGLFVQTLAVYERWGGSRRRRGRCPFDDAVPTLFPLKCVGIIFKYIAVQINRPNFNLL